jgi:serine protease Do
MNGRRQQIELRHMKRVFYNLNSRLAAIVLGGAVVVAGSAFAFSQKAKTESFNAPSVDERPITRELGSHTSFSPVVKKVTPGVVKVVVSMKAPNANARSDESSPMDDFLRRFFGDQFQGRMPRPDMMPRQEGLGSGVIVTKDGYILTNNHVVDGADEVKVTLQDRREFTAKVIGRDPQTDIAVIKIDAKDLPVVPMADSDKVEVGDVVLAIGNPFNIGQTVTSGIVSATGRGGAIGLDYEDFIQTDAAINPGNSGGALVDADGRLIGINTAILSRSGGNQGIGFAVPSNLARDVMDNLVTDGHVTRGYLGVMIQDLNPALAKKFDLKDTKGVLIGDVTPKSPAERAGIQNGDVVTEFNGKNVSDSRHLKLQVARTQPGTTVPIKILRDGTPKTVEVTVKELPGTRELAKNDKPAAQDNGTLNGVAVADVDRRSRQQFEIPNNVKGVVVTEVAPNSAAAEAGLKAGDVIQEINRKPVTSADEAVRMTEKTTDKVSLLRVWSSNGNTSGSHYVVVDESKAG